MMTQADIEQLKRRVDQLTFKLSIAKGQLGDALIAVYPIRVGDRMVSRIGEAEVTRLDVRYGRVVMFGRRVLKSGKLHATQRELHRWDGWQKKNAS